MQVRWTDEAAEDLRRIVLYIREDSSEAAMRVARRIYETAMSLEAFPYKGRVTEKGDLRELVVAASPYIVAYEMGEDALFILHIFHGARGTR